ncbi:alpha/beta fold hydrolase [Janibacter sp. GXQ6167]|uniref:alpha/beta fold hydrolase n=1 Tax=Janibacter sp. GXQ6167 TaxID=3240791 RepID=UPI003523AEE4
MIGPGERLEVVADEGSDDGLGCIVAYLPGMARPGRDAFGVIERVGRGRHLALERASVREALTSPATLTAQVEALDDVLATHAPDAPAIVVAHSYAGLSAIAWAARRPDRCRALLLLDTSIPTARAPLTPLRWRWGIAHSAARATRARTTSEAAWRWAGAIEENASYAEVSREAHDEVRDPLRAPTVVVTARPLIAGPFARSWISTQEALAGRLGALHTMVWPSGHLIPTRRPGDIAALIRAAQGGPADTQRGTPRLGGLPKTGRTP